MSGEVKIIVSTRLLLKIMWLLSWLPSLAWFILLIVRNPTPEEFTRTQPMVIGSFAAVGLWIMLAGVFPLIFAKQGDSDDT